MALVKDIEVAEFIKEKTLQAFYIPLDTKEYTDFISTVKTPKEWADEKYKVNTETEYFTFKARHVAEMRGYQTNIITYLEKDKLCFALIYRDYLIDMHRAVDFYEDMELDLVMITSLPKFNVPWTLFK